MSDPKISEVLADAFASENVDTHFALMGNGNMYWVDALAKRHNVRVIHARHEHCAVAMADGYSRATGKVATASVTCGPGFTQIMTALMLSARTNIPLVVFVGDAPINMSWHVHKLDQAPLANAVGAHFISVNSKDRMLNDVRDAFYIAQTERRPVVLSVPEDFQHQEYPYFPNYMASHEILPTPQRIVPSPELIERAADMFAAAERPAIIAGRGAVLSGAGPAIEALAEQTGAALATSLLAKGLFDHNPYGLGISGGFASDLAREVFAEADLVLGIGAIMGYYTSNGGYLYPGAQVIHLDTHPRGLSQGARVADLQITADAKLGAEALLDKMRAKGISGKGFRTEDLKERIATNVYDPKHFDLQPNTVDPRQFLLEIDKVVPADWDLVIGGGHFFDFAMTHLHNRAPERYHVSNDGNIGSGLAAAIGVATARGDGKVLLIEGDGAMLMHIQELETIKRHNLKLLMCVLNDGAYGAEVHKFVGKGLNPNESMHGRGDLAAVAKGFGLRGDTIQTMGRCRALFEAHQQSGQATVWDVHISANIPSRQYRRVYFGEV